MKTFNYKLTFSFLAVISLLFVSCEEIWDPDHCVDGNGDRKVETRSLQSFDRIVVNGDFDVRIDEGFESSAEIVTDENLVDLIVTHVSGDKLIIETRNGICINPSHRIEVIVTTNELNALTLNGSGSIYCYELNTEDISIDLNGSGEIEFDELTADHAEVELAGSGEITCTVFAESVSSRIEGSGEIKLQGNCVTGEYEIIGSGKIKAGELSTTVCTVHISGSGAVDTRVSTSLDVSIIGSGIVYYSGDPVIERYISGSGKIIER